MSTLKARVRGLASVLTAATLILIPLHVSAAKADGASSDTSLSVFTVNGNSVSDNDVINLSAGTTSVTVNAETNDPDASLTISGGSNLTAGDNPLTVSVTAADGVTTEDHSVTLRVASYPSDTSLLSFTVNGSSVSNGDTVNLAAYTSSVTVAVVTNDPGANYSITGGTGLTAGDNSLSVLVTAQNGSTSTYTVNLKVALSSNSGLTSFKVNGSTVANGDSVNLNPHTTSVDVDVTTSDVNSTYTITGGTGLTPGNNSLVVKVTAPDGTFTNYEVNLNVLLSSDNSLSSFTVNGVDVAAGETVNLDPYTTSVEAVATATDVAAVAVVTGDTDLVSGSNTLTVTVTAENGDVQEYNYTLIVAAGNDTSLKTFTINGVDFVNATNDLFLDPYTTAVTVVAEPTDSSATLEITGGSGLITGDNSLIVTVTAPNGDVASYPVNLVVAPGDNTALDSLQVNDTLVSNGDTVDLEPYTTSVDVLAVTTDPNASYEVSGETDLVAGENLLTVTVTAEDGVTTDSFFVTLNVLLSTNTDLIHFVVNDTDVMDGDLVSLDPYTTDVTVYVETDDENATFELTGDTDLLPGENTLTVVVTAADGVTTATYEVTLDVALGNNTDLATFEVNGESVLDGDTIELDPYTTEVEVVVQTVDPDATYTITGDTDLVSGENALIVTVRAVDGFAATDYIVNLNVAIGDNATLSSFQVNGEDVSDGDTVDLAPYTTEVEVTAETTDPDATFVVDGDTGLEAGPNTLIVTVTAPDGVSTTDYQVVLNVLYSTDTSVSTLQVNGSDVEDGDSVNLDPYTTDVEVTVEATDVNSTIAITGDTNLSIGDNILTVTVTAPSGDAQEYVINLVVPQGDNTTLATFQVNGEDVSDGDIINLAPKTSSVEVYVETTDPNASFEISGAEDLGGGTNELVVTVTAENGVDTSSYVVVLNVEISNDTSLSEVTINGEDVMDSGEITVETGTESVDVVAEATDVDAQVLVDGDTGLVPGENTVTVTVTAADGETTQIYEYTVYVQLNDDTSLASFTVDGEEVSDGDVVTVDYDVTSVGVMVETSD
ncbi:MAG: hypothetical protein RIQ88_542, partial [Actinomycetota bacterium]